LPRSWRILVLRFTRTSGPPAYSGYLRNSSNRPRDIGVVVACKNYDENWKVGMDVLKEMEMAAKTLKASKVVIVTTSDFSSQARNYAVRET